MFRLGTVLTKMGREFIMRGKMPEDYACCVIRDEDMSEWADSERPLLVFVDGKPAPTCEEVQAKRHELENAERWRLLREERDQLLKKTDYLMSPDYPHTEEQRKAWAAYRQALRDLPSATTDPAAVVWPVLG
jgi:hypothetical protein